MQTEVKGDTYAKRKDFLETYHSKENENINNNI